MFFRKLLINLNLSKETTLHFTWYLILKTKIDMSNMAKGHLIRDIFCKEIFVIWIVNLVFYIIDGISSRCRVACLENVLFATPALTLEGVKEVMANNTPVPTDGDRKARA